MKDHRHHRPRYGLQIRRRPVVGGPELPVEEVSALLEGRELPAPDPLIARVGRVSERADPEYHAK